MILVLLLLLLIGLLSLTFDDGFVLFAFIVESVGILL